MKKELKAIICVVLSVWFFVMGFEIGSYHEKKAFMSTTVPNVVRAPETNPSNNQYDAPTASTIPTTDLANNTTAPTGTTPADATTQNNGEPSAPKKDDPSSMSKTDILSKATLAINKLKSEPNFNARKTENTTITLVDCSSDAALKIINNFIQKLAGEKTANYKFVNGQATGVDDSGKEIKDEGVVTPKDVIPPTKALFTLAPDGVKDATAVSSGDGAVYTIKLEEEKTNIDNPIPYHNSKAIGYLDLTSIKIPGASFTEANMHYPESIVTVTVDGKGRVTNLHCYLPMDGNGAAKMGFISGTATFEGANDEVWEITY